MTEDNNNPALAKAKKKRHRPLWWRILKWVLVAGGILAVLVAGVCSLVVWTLTPAKLTPLVEKAASDYLRADVTIGRVELTFWHTFPKMSVEVDSLCIVSRVFQDAPPEISRILPPGADSLLTLGRFAAGMDLAPLAAGRLSLYDIELRDMALNMVQATDSLANYQIIPLDPADTTAIEIPPLTLRRFSITGASPLRFRSLMDSTDIRVSLRQTSLVGEKEPQYRLDVDGGSLNTPVLEAFNFHGLTFGAQGTLRWQPQRPLALEMEDFDITVDQYKARLSTALDFTHDPVVKTLTASLPDLPMERLLSHAPEALQPMLRPLKTDMTASATLELRRPWTLADTLLPSVRAQVVIPPCRLTYQNVRLQRFEADMTADFDGRDINGSVLRLRHLRLDGQAVAVDLRADITNILLDPRVKGRLKGNINLGSLPPALKQQIPVELQGKVLADADFAMALSDLTPNTFHRLRANGRVVVEDLKAVAQGIATAMVNRAVFDFGTNRSLEGLNGTPVDSLLQVSLTIDTLSANGMGMDLALKDLSIKAGTVNRSYSSDTAEINPFGGRIDLERLRFSSIADSARITLRKAVIGASLRRFEGGRRSPLIRAGFAMDRMGLRQGPNRVSLREAQMELTTHLRQRRPYASEADSLARAARRAARLRSGADSAAVEADNIDFDLGAQEKSLLRKWNFDGTLRARRGRMVTPFFPLRNVLANVDVAFSQDSLVLRDLSYRAGQSDFTVNGTITNLRRALTSRNRSQPLNVDLSVACDTLNVNELVHALFAGAGVGNSLNGNLGGDDDNDEASERLLQAAADTAPVKAFVVPQNLNARVVASARNILYSDLWLRDFRGELLVLGGNINLRDLHACTDIGAASLQALYTAPDTASLSFGMGLQVNNFRLDRLTALVPAIDTLMPAMKGLEGIVNADIAVTTDLYPNMDIDIPSLRAALSIEGDSLVLLDADTFKSLSKWLMFKNKKRNLIDHMGVEAVIENSTIELYPFMFDIDRYRLGVMGYNDMAMNLNYHVSVLKSPLPFKFGINITGTTDKMKIRIGKAKFKPGMVGERQAIADTTRVNLVRQIDNLFRRGLDKARRGALRLPQGRPGRSSGVDITTEGADTLTAAEAQQLDSLR